MERRMTFLTESSSGMHDGFDHDGFDRNSTEDRESLDFKPDAERIQQTNDLAIGLGIDEKKLLWKVDLCVVPPFILLYFLAFLDRINISNAKVYGMISDLDLKGNQFNVALTIFFVPYIFFDIISNISMKRIPPHIWLSGSIFLFGLVTLAIGFVKNYSGLLACRFFLGLLEAGMFPGIFYVLSTYYTGAESQKRFSTFFSCTCLSGAAGGAIAYRIHDLEGVHGYASWRWIFIIEGTITTILAGLLYFVIPDFPENSRFMSLKEKEFIKRKLEIHSVESGFEVKFGWKDVIKSLSDPLFALTALAYFALVVPSYGYAYFSPTIIGEMGYTAVSANSHSVYPWLVAFGYSIGLAFISDLVKIRSPFAISSALLAIVGLALVLGLPENAQGRYAGCFLAVTGLYSSMPSLICWTDLNYGGHLRKSVGTASQIGFGNVGGIIATFLFLAEDAPRYVQGLSVGIGFCVLSIATMITMIMLLRFRNNAKRTEEYRMNFFKQDDRTIVLEGDKHPSYKYLY